MNCHIYEQIGKFLEPKELVNCLMVNKDWLHGFERHRSSLKLHSLLHNDILPANIKDFSDYLMTGSHEMFYDYKRFRINYNLKPGRYKFIKVSNVFSFPSKNNWNMLIIKKYYKNLDALNLF